jgi:hypothetical protein
LFRRALISPNENSVAQVEWANRQIGGLEIEQSLSDVPRSHEAPAHVALATGEWNDAIGHGLNWLGDQPFSKRPAIFTSYVTSLIENYGKSIKILRASLRVNAHDPMLVNNLAFALASDNQVEKAVETLRGTDYNRATGVSAITLAATHGLVLFRTGFPDRGRTLYNLAIEKATTLAARNYRVMAELYLAREELVANTAVAEQTAKRALAKALKSDSPEVGVIAAQVLRLFKAWARSGGVTSSERIPGNKG